MNVSQVAHQSQDDDHNFGKELQGVGPHHGQYGIVRNCGVAEKFAFAALDSVSMEGSRRVVEENGNSWCAIF
jgi:hypothetical protein